MGTTPLSPVTAPLAVPPRVGLIASAPPADTLERWEGGFTFLPEGCGSGSGVVDPCVSSTKILSNADNAAVVEFEPFGVWAGFSCSSFGFEANDYQGRARRLMEACESKLIAREFWTGAQAKASGWPNRFLASEDSDVLSPDGTGFSALQALACLEAGLGECSCGARGMIHATRQTVLLWSQNQLLRREGGLTLTINDTIVVADAGYDGSSPLGAPPADGAIWAYATGMVQIRRGPVNVVPDSFSEALDRQLNTIDFRSERLAAVIWDGCCHLAVQLDIDLCGIGGS